MTTGNPCVRAVTMTLASMTSFVPDRPQSWPAARAVRSSSACTTTSFEPSRRASVAWRAPPRQTWPTTPAGTRIVPPPRRISCTSTTTKRSSRSNAINAPASKTALTLRADAPARGVPDEPREIQPPSSARRSPRASHRASCRDPRASCVARSPQRRRRSTTQLLPVERHAWRGATSPGEDSPRSSSRSYPWYYQIRGGSANPRGNVAPESRPSYRSIRSTWRCSARTRRSRRSRCWRSCSC